MLPLEGHKGYASSRQSQTAPLQKREIIDRRKPFVREHPCLPARGAAGRVLPREGRKGPPLHVAGLTPEHTTPCGLRIL